MWCLTLAGNGLLKMLLFCLGVLFIHVPYAFQIPWVFFSSFSKAFHACWVIRFKQERNHSLGDFNECGLMGGGSSFLSFTVRAVYRDSHRVNGLVPSYEAQLGLCILSCRKRPCQRWVYFDLNQAPAKGEDCCHQKLSIRSRSHRRHSLHQQLV